MHAEQQIRQSINQLLPLLFPLAGTFNTDSLNDGIFRASNAGYSIASVDALRVAARIIEQVAVDAESRDKFHRCLLSPNSIADYERAMQHVSRSSFGNRVISTDVIIVELPAIKSRIEHAKPINNVSIDYLIFDNEGQAR